jgi:co-chaperonin GroES (HSP10)
MNLKPTEDRLIVEVDKDADVTKGGIHLPTRSNGESPHTGTILVIGPDVSTLQAKDRVVFARYVGHDYVAEDDKTYKILRTSDILATL